jgi:hypothetical protein
MAVCDVRPEVVGGLLVLVAFLALALPPPASAHLRTGVVAVDYRARVFPLLGPLHAAVVVRVYETDQALGLTARQGHVVVALGYTGEPFLRIDSGGAAVNASSPTAAVYTIDNPEKRAVGFKLSEGMDVPAELASRFKFASQKSKLAGTIRGSYFAFKNEY